MRASKSQQPSRALVRSGAWLEPFGQERRSDEASDAVRSGAGGRSEIVTLAEGVTLIPGDCAEVLPTIATADAMVTDPPFGIGFDYGDAHDDDPLK